MIEQVIRWRSAAILIAALLILGFWTAEGSQIISALNPTLGQQLAVAAHPPLSVWVTAPDSSSNNPLIISTPAGVRYEDRVIDIVQGSTISAHLADGSGEAPELVIDGNGQDFVLDAHGDYAASQKLENGQKLQVKRGWLTLASWKINVIPDAAPHVQFVDAPIINESKAIRIAYEASDQFGISDVVLRVLPHDPMPGANNEPTDIPLTITSSKTLSHVDFEDFTARPWAGQKVTLALVVTNLGGKKTVSKPVDVSVPERTFFHPVARVLIEERRRLMLHPTNEPLREETANVMATIAHDTSDYHGDPVVLMALRSGAVRLILDKDLSSAISVNDLLFQAAARIEDGNTGTAFHVLHDARGDLASAISRDAGPEEIQFLTARLKQALGTFVNRSGDGSSPSSARVQENAQKAP